MVMEAALSLKVKLGKQSLLAKLRRAPAPHDANPKTATAHSRDAAQHLQPPDPPRNSELQSQLALAAND